MKENTRRALVKRLGAIAVLGYVAPKVTTVKPAYACCFVAGSKVLMADGREMNVEDVAVGDRVLGHRGAVNTVMGIERPKLGSRKLFAFNGGRHFVTAEHPFLTTTGWKSIDPTATAAENAALSVETLGVGDIVVTGCIATRCRSVGSLALAPHAALEEGTVVIASIEATTDVPERIVYNLLLDGDHTYIADGYTVHNKRHKGHGSGGGGSGPPMSPVLRR